MLAPKDLRIAALGERALDWGPGYLGLGHGLPQVYGVTV